MICAKVTEKSHQKLESSTQTGNDKKWNQMKNKLQDVNVFSPVKFDIRYYIVYRATTIIWHSMTSSIGKFSKFWLLDYVMYFERKENYLNGSWNHYFLRILTGWLLYQCINLVYNSFLYVSKHIIHNFVLPLDRKIFKISK